MLHCQRFKSADGCCRIRIVEYGTSSHQSISPGISQLFPGHVVDSAVNFDDCLAATQRLDGVSAVSCV